MPISIRRRTIGAAPLLILLASVALAMTTDAGAQDETPASNATPPPQGVSVETIVSTLDGTEQPYNLYVPKGHDPAGAAVPLIVVLHGWGATWKTWFAATKVCEWAEAEGYVVAAPHGRGNWFYLGPGEQDVLDTIEDVAARCNIDRDRIYLIGHSMGGWGTWHTACAHPDLFAAIVPMSCWSPAALLGNLRDMPVLLIHGADDDVVPVEESRRSAELMAEARGHDKDAAPFEYIEAPGYGHESKMISDMFPRIGEFLRGKRRAAPTLELTHAAYMPSRGRRGWLQILAVDNWPEVSEVSVTATDLVGYVGDTNPPPANEAVRVRNVSAFGIRPDLFPASDGDPDLRFQQLDKAAREVSLSDKITPGNGILYERNPETGYFEASVVPLSVFENYPEPVYASPDEIPSDAAAYVTELVRAGMDVDLALLPEHHIAPELPPAPWTASKVFEFYLRYDDSLQASTLDAAAYADLVKRAEDFPPWWKLTLPATPPKESTTVVFPKYVERILGVDGEETGRTVREVIFEALGPPVGTTATIRPIE